MPTAPFETIAQNTIQVESQIRPTRPIVEYIRGSVDMLKKVAALLALTGYVMVMTGCNTMEGLGRDVNAGGQKIQQEAQEHKPR
jgi:predicted small secreted protein